MVPICLCLVSSALTIVVNVSLTLVNQAEPDKSFTKGELNTHNVMLDSLYLLILYMCSHRI